MLRWRPLGESESANRCGCGTESWHRTRRRHSHSKISGTNIDGGMQKTRGSLPWTMRAPQVRSPDKYRPKPMATHGVAVVFYRVLLA